MQIKIESKELDKPVAHYFIFEAGGKTFSIETNAAKAIALIWVFIGLCMLAFIAGKELAYTEQMLHAYMLQGNLTTEDGRPVECKPVLSEESKRIVWQCKNLNVR